MLPRVIAIYETNFAIEEARSAGDTWKFNCGPGALCAVTGMKPGEIRPLPTAWNASKYLDAFQERIEIGAKIRMSPSTY